MGDKVVGSLRFRRIKEEVKHGEVGASTALAKLDRELKESGIDPETVHTYRWLRGHAKRQHEGSGR